MVLGKDHLSQKHIFICPGTGEAMPFVYSQQVPNRRTLFFESLHHLFGAFVRHTPVVLPLNDEHGLFYLVAVIERGDLLEKRPHLRIALVAILLPHFIRRKPVILELQNEARRAQVRERGRDSIVVIRRRGQRQITPVTASLNKHFFSVKIRLSLDPIEQCADVFCRTLPPIAVVKFHEGFAIPGRTTEVWINQGDAKLVYIVIIFTSEPRSKLRERWSMPTVKVDYDRALACEFFGRTNKVARDHPPVETLPFNLLRIRE